ncbi:MAG TPA: DNA-3-methyladenine glycosylase [Usitatibacter sp.]|nr:DNA-3-methyladenine glycosylase [Usitatibacter sp.]
MIPDFWHDATAHLGRRDKVLRKLIGRFPEPDLVSRGDAFQTLARSIVGQQISVKAAQSIWARFATLAGEMTPARVRTLEDAALRGCGFSGQKAAYVKDLAMRFDEGLVKPRRWRRLDDEAIIEELVQVKGIGRWTVEMFLIFHMKRPDVLPVGDLGLRRAMENLYNAGEELTREEMRVLGEPWAPFRSVATWYLWRSLDAVAL